MGQYTRLLRSLLVLVAIFVALLSGACDRSEEPSANYPAARRSDKPTVASLVPAATEILFAMGLQDQIVGVSNYDPDTPEREGIARVGDYLTADWEQLTTIRPQVLVIHRPKEEMAPVFRERASRLGITLVDLHIDRLEEIYPVISKLGEAAAAEEAAQQLIARMRGELGEIQKQVEGRPRIRTLIVLDETAKFTVGPRNFLDDLLTIAGGENVAADLEKDYPTIDREKLLALNPDAIIQLLPGAPEQVVTSARRFWEGLPQLNAVANGKVFIHSEPHLLLPGPRVTEVAAIMARDLHPLTATSSPTTNNP